MTGGKSGRGLTAGGHYFADKDQIGNERLRLAPDEARHAVRALRLGVGDEIAVVDGVGGWYRACIEVIDRDGLVATIEERRRGVGEPPYDLTIAIGVLKQQARFETFLEKAVELGVTRIIPLMSERRQSSGINHKRSHRILVAGMKQSLRSKLPVLTEPKSLDAVLRERAQMRLIAHETAASDESLLTFAKEIAEAGSLNILIGPEGGFSEREVSRAAQAGWRLVSLGSSRLRTETAGIAAASFVQLIKSNNAES
jgi:16S rRNA (uracil1498-N3)-methyltransferase